MSFQSWFGAFENAGGSWLGFGILIVNFWYGQWSLIHPYSKFRLSIFILKVQRSSMSFKSWSGTLEDPRGSWLGFGILILIWIWSLVFNTPMIKIFALYLDFEGTKKIYVLLVLIWGFGRYWRFLIGVCHLDQDSWRILILWQIYIEIFICLR